MQLEERKVGDVTVIVVSGDITQNKGGDLVLKNRVRDVLQQGRKKLILDLGGVSYVDSAGLGELVQAYATTKKEGGMLKLVAVTTRLRDLLTITKLVTVFDSYESQADAVASFATLGLMVQATGQPRLIVRDASGRRTVLLDKPVLTFGRRSESDVCLAGADVSRLHAEIRAVRRPRSDCGTAGHGSARS